MLSRNLGYSDTTFSGRRQRGIDIEYPTTEHGIERIAAKHSHYLHDHEQEHRLPALRGTKQGRAYQTPPPLLDHDIIPMPCEARAILHDHPSDACPGAQTVSPAMAHQQATVESLYQASQWTMVSSGFRGPVLKAVPWV